MAADGILVNGARLYYSLDNSNFTELSDMKEMGTPAPAESKVDMTPLADNSDARAFRLALMDAGELEAKQFFTKARMDALVALKRTLLYWRIRIPDSAVVANMSRLDFQAWLGTPTSSQFTNPDDPVTIDFKLMLTGAVTFTSGS